MNYRLFKIVFSLIFLFNFGIISAQVSSRGTENLKYARDLAFNGQRAEAIEICKKILKKSSDNDDVRLLLGRIYAWEGRYNEARKTLLKLNNQNSVEALRLRQDVELWSKNYETLLTLCDVGLKMAPNNEEFLFLKASAQNKLGDIDGAGNTLNKLLNLNPSHKKALSMRNLIDLAGVSNAISLSYNLSLFNSNFDPWHLYYLELSRKFKFGSLIIRLNYASRFNKNDYQVESDGYISIADGIYSYLNIGVSPSVLFPDLRFGVEPYFKLPYSMEFSIGYRYLLFDKNKVDLFTGHLGKYIGNYWISVRPFITPKEGRTDFSGILIIRRYLSDSDNYISLQAGLGFIPTDEVNGNSYLSFDSKKIGIELQTSLSNLLLLKNSFQYGEEEYISGRWRKNYEFKLGLKQRF